MRSNTQPQLGAQLFFELLQTFVTEKRDAGVAVILDGQVAPKGTHLLTLDAIEIGFGGKRRANDLLSDASGIDNRVKKLIFINLHETYVFIVRKKLRGFFCLLLFL